MSKETYMSIESGALGALVAKYGTVKLLTLGAALVGAVMMAIFRPPKTRKEMMYQGGVALGASLLFGNTVYSTLLQWFPIDYVAAHGLTGALSWAVFGGAASWLERFSKNPTEAIKDAKDSI
jgi:hypothetical protein